MVTISTPTVHPFLRRPGGTAIGQKIFTPAAFLAILLAAPPALAQNADANDAADPGETSGTAAPESAPDEQHEITHEANPTGEDVPSRDDAVGNSTSPMTDDITSGATAASTPAAGRPTYGGRWTGRLSDVAGRGPTEMRRGKVDQGDGADATPVEGEGETGAASAESAISGSLGWIARTLIGLSVVVLLALLVKRLLVRVAGPLAGARAPSGVIEVLGRFPFGRAQSLSLLRIGRRIILVSQHAHAVTTLTEFSDPDEVADLLRRVEAASGGTFSQRLQQLIDGGDEAGDMKRSDRRRSSTTAAARSAATGGRPSADTSASRKRSGAEVTPRSGTETSVEALQRMLDERRTAATSGVVAAAAGTAAGATSSGQRAGRELPIPEVRPRSNAKRNATAAGTTIASRPAVSTADRAAEVRDRLGPEEVRA